jgi:hypothetical protein
VDAQTTVNGIAFAITNSGTMNVNADLGALSGITNSGNIYINSLGIVTGTITGNIGNLYIVSGNSANVNGTFINITGAVTMVGDDLTINGTTDSNNTYGSDTAVVTGDASYILNVKGGTVSASGAFADINVDSGATLSLTGVTTVGGQITNAGTLNVDAQTTVNGIAFAITNSGTMNVNAALVASNGITNSGNIYINSLGTVTGTITGNNGNLYIVSGKSANVNGTFANITGVVTMVGGDLTINGTTDSNNTYGSNTAVVTGGASTGYSLKVTGGIVDISDGKFTGVNYGLEVANGTVTVTGGIFTGTTNAVLVTSGILSVTGGYFSDESMAKPINYIAEGYTYSRTTLESNTYYRVHLIPPYSGGGGGSSTSAVNTGVNIMVNGKTENAGTASNTTKVNQTVTTITVNEMKLEQKLEQEGNNAVVTIPVNTKSDIVIGELNGQMLKNMENKQAVLEVKTEIAAYIISAQQINISAISEQIGRSVELKDIKVQIEISKPTSETVKVVENSAKKGEFTIIAPPMEFNIKCSYGNKTLQVSSFNTYVERTIAIPDGIDPSKITTGIVVDTDGTVRHVPTKVIAIDGKYYAKINSLTNSLYTVVWNPLVFKDAANHWAKAEINDMGSRMVVNGASNGLFEPDRDITRAEFATIMVRALGLKPEIGTNPNPFTDVKASDWYRDFVKTAYEYKLISGYSADKFGPMDEITREQAMTMITRAMKITGLKVDFANEEIDKLLADFGDGVQTADYAKSSIGACVKTGIVTGRNGNMIAPKDNITRAEVAVIVQRMLQKSNLI